MSESDAVTNAQSIQSNENQSILLGCVKWFNNKAGYGFLSVIDGEHLGKDIFVHHTGIGLSENQYKYLVQGEYVEFVLSHTPNGTHEFQAVNVTGIKGGKLMCKTISEMKEARSHYRKKDEGEEVGGERETLRQEKGTNQPRSMRAPRGQGRKSQSA